MPHKTQELRRAAIRRRVIRFSAATMAAAGVALIVTTFGDGDRAMPDQGAWIGPTGPAADATAAAAGTGPDPDAAPEAPRLDRFTEAVIADGASGALMMEAGVDPHAAARASDSARIAPVAPPSAGPATATPTPGLAARADIALSDATEARGPLEARSGGRRIVLASVQPTRAGECTPAVTHAALAAATVGLEIAAPCDPGARVVLRHGDMPVALRLDADGQAAVDLPALAAPAEVEVEIEGRDPVRITEAVDDFDRFRRVALYWKGDLAPELHAYEDGAGPGDPGHVGPHAPRTIAHALSRHGGYFVSLGDPGLSDARLAQVYTVPTDRTVTLGLEVPVTARNCEADLSGGLIRPAGGGAMRSDEVAIRLPRCGAIGDMLVVDDVIRLRPEPLADAG